MAEARGQWIGSLMALQANCHRDPTRTRAFRVEDFDPFAKRPRPIPVDLADLKPLFERLKTGG